MPGMARELDTKSTSEAAADALLTVGSNRIMIIRARIYKHPLTNTGSKPKIMGGQSRTAHEMAPNFLPAGAMSAASLE
ncbi:hypothetical protein PM082_014542 [Marasmius tenuissimus]|nr:hypothetical protein PM082_014542 [Marasmius tenuissimus]